MIKTYNSVDGLPKVIEKLINEAVLEDFENWQSEYETSEEVDVDKEIIFQNYEIRYNYTRTSYYDEDEDEYQINDDLKVVKIDEYLVEELLKDNNISFKASNRSESIYLNDGETRLSTHKRSSYGDNGIYEHDYQKEMIFSDSIELYNYVKKHLTDLK